MNSITTTGPHQHTDGGDRFPISILTGFLGAGKTTVLNHLMKQPEFSRSLVIVNEFGEVALDHDLMTHVDGDEVIEMSSGCICCTFRADLAKTLREAPWRFSRNGETWFDRVIIETTGLADPAPILHTLLSDLSVVSRYRLDGLITMVDAANGMATLDRQIEALKQAAVADRIVLTKSDLVDQRTLDLLQGRLQALNPAAVQLFSQHGVVDPASIGGAGLYHPETKSIDVQNWLKEEAYAEVHGFRDLDDNRHDANINAVCLTMDKPVDEASVDRWLEELHTLKAADLLRVKAIMNVKDAPGPFVVHGVQHVIHPIDALCAWPSKDRRSRIVFITRNISRAELEATLRCFDSQDDLHTEEPNSPVLHPGEIVPVG
ncbi:MAG: GTP-binding protein [Pseudomonadota bacterium]